MGDLWKQDFAGLKALILGVLVPEVFVPEVLGQKVLAVAVPLEQSLWPGNLPVVWVWISSSFSFSQISYPKALVLW